ncbi:MAG: hypothetical protein PF693_09205 [Spirochaetia bacterium]|jgi:hypothetical protein|nr:hypothetical protein [Spirochaetia bacterium]
MKERQSNFRLRITEKQFGDVLKHKEALRQGDIVIALCGVTKNENQSLQNVVLTTHSIFISTISTQKDNIQSVYEWIEKNCKMNDFYLLCFSFGDKNPKDIIIHEDRYRWIIRDW